MRYTGTIQATLNLIALPAEAVDWLIDVWDVCQLLDDACDGDEIGRERAENAAWALFVRMPANAFWRANMANLMPVLAVQVLKWRAANDAEEDGVSDERSLVWRAGYYDRVLLVCQLCGKADDPKFILSLYGEAYADYGAEMHPTHSDGAAHA